ncbi:MAG: hypothetical protein QM743_13635 [Chitinophagaceae bacterium]
MIFMYAVVMIAMILCIVTLSRKRRMKNMQPGSKRVPVADNRAHTNAGGNSSRDEQENTATQGDIQGQNLPMGADNDDDRR